MPRPLDRRPPPAAPRTLVAFLRGLNVGGHRVTMDRLLAVFEDLGLPGARTFLASGNVIFEGPWADPIALERDIEAALARELGYAVDTFVRSAEHVTELATLDPFPAEPRSADDKVHVIFLKEPLPDPGQALGAVVPRGDLFVVRDRDVFWLRRGKLSEAGLRASDPVQAVSRAPSTMRGMNTVRRLAATLPVTPPAHHLERRVK